MSRMLYASAVGSLMYVMICTRLDIAQVVGVVGKFVKNPGRALKYCLEDPLDTSNEPHMLHYVSEDYN